MNKDQSIEKIKKTTTSSGLRVITETIKSVRSVSVGIWIKTGSRHERDSLAGITHFLEHMLFKGTETRSAFDISSSIEAAGGYLNAFTSSEYTCYYARCLDTELEKALDVLSDMVLHSTFPEKEIEKEKKVVIEEMKMYRDSPEDYIFEEFSSQVFENHPLGRPIIGFESTVSAFNRDDLFAYMAERYQPETIIITVAGNASHSKVLNLAKHFFKEKKAKEVKEIKSVLSPYKTQKRILTKQIEQTHYIMGKRSLSSIDEDRYKLLLIQAVLSGGMSSRLHQNIREKYGYCYSINSFIQSFGDTGLFGVYVGTDKEYLDHVKDLIFKEFKDLREKEIPEKEFGEAKTQLKGKLLLSQESMSSRMTRLAKSEIYFNRYISLDELTESIDKVSSKDVQNFANAFFDEEDFTETILLPESNN